MSCAGVFGWSQWAKSQKEKLGINSDDPDEIVYFSRKAAGVVEPEYGRKYEQQEAPETKREQEKT